MKPARAEIARAVLTMSKIIPFFPDDDIGQEFVVRAVEEFISTKEQLDWLTKAACNNMKRFSLPELRGIFCSRYDPADGMRTVAETPGFTTAEVEAAAEERYRQREAAEYGRKLEAWKQEAKLLGTRLQPFLLPPITNTMEPKPGTTPAPEGPAVKEPLPEKKPALKELEAELAAQASLARKRTPEEQARLLAEMERKLKGA